MKTQDKQIVAMLQAFNKESVLKAFELYARGIKNKFKKTKEELGAEGWSPQENKPVNREYYVLDGMYWVQSEEMRNRQINARIAAMKKKKASSAARAKKKQSMGLKLTRLKCPVCQAGMYKQSVCPGCAEGGKGFKIRLLCEEDPDHEVLL